MLDFIKTSHRLMKGTGWLFLFTITMQLFMGAAQIFETFLIKVLVDVFEGIEQLDKAVALEKSVIFFLTGGRGNQYLIDNGRFILPTAMIVVGVSWALLMFLRLWTRSFFSAAVNRRMQLSLFYHVAKLPYESYKKNKEGDLLQTATRDITVLRKFYSMDFSSITWAVWMVVFCFIVLVNLSWKMTLSSTFLFLPLFIYSAFLTRRVRNLYRKCDDSEAILTDKVSENLASVRIVKAFNNETYEISSFEKQLADYREKFLNWRRFSSFFFSSTDIFVFLSKVLSLLFGIYFVYVGEINPGTLVVAFLYVDMMVWPIRESASCLSNMGQNIASADRIKLLIDQKLEDIDTGLTPNIEGNIEFSHVDFSYPDGNEPVLKDVSFSVKKGQTIAIMGKTGSGKSTLLLILTRLYDYEKGSIKIDGVELKDIQKRHLRKNLVPVLQDPFLFSRTIEENLKIARPQASNEEMIKATEIADVDLTIRQFQKGYATSVGEKGVTLSGGQRQRVAIARTLLTEAPILIFDDSLSAVDMKTDYTIRENLRKNAFGKTTFLITHRVSSAKTADKIIVLDEGKISQMGTHEELLSQEGLYRRIATIQSKMEAN